MAKVTALMTEPSSNTPLVIMLVCSLRNFLSSWLGLKSGSETRAMISPVLISSHDAAGGHGLELGDRLCQLIGQRMLHARVDRDLRRACRLAGASASEAV